MAVHLESPAFQFVIRPEQAAWDLYGNGEHDPAVVGARVSVAYRCGRPAARLSAVWAGPQVSAVETVASPQGPLRQVSIQYAPEAQGLRLRLVFALPEGQPLALWKLVAANQGSQPVMLDRLELLGPSGGAAPVERGASAIRNLAPAVGGRLAFFANGWQSWSHAGAYRPQDTFLRTRLGPLSAPMTVNAGTPQPLRKGHFASDMFGVLGWSGEAAGQPRRALLAGFLSQRQHFGSLEAWIAAAQPDLRLWANGDGARLDPGAAIETDWACLQLVAPDEPDPLAPYLEAVAREHGLPPAPDSPVPTGWCSWYQYSAEDYAGGFTAQDVRSNLEALARLRSGLPLEIVQIDDGYQTRVADWYSFRPAFPAGVAPLAAEIRAAGFTPGLWLAPFIVDRRSRLAAEHPDWLLRGPSGRPVNAGYLWDGIATALDLTHPLALEHAVRVVQTAVHEWGFSYLKFDFLYAAALPGRYRDPTRTRAQVLRQGLQALRSAAGPQTTLLGCGCPLGSGLGLMDAMRIGPDVAQRWRPTVKGITVFFQREPTLPAARNAIRNTLTRAALHRRWWINDPDCLLLNPRSHLSLEEVRTTAAAIALTGGSLLLSDDLAHLPPQRLRIARALLPVIDRRPWVLDWLDVPTPRRLRLDLDGPAGPWHLLALFNWDNRPRNLALRLADYGLNAQQDYLAREFWSGEVARLKGDQPLKRSLLAHASRLWALRRAAPGRPQYLGSDLHISQGLEVVDWRATKKNVSLRLERPGDERGQVVLSLPMPPRHAQVNGASSAWQTLGGDVYTFEVQAERGTARLEVRFA
jgi:alpha-galactosidase